MSGKSYTMREMKAIVDYLKEHRAFGEIRGRKMWIDYANTNLTTRTWQSLKETFLKRILPDITNSYYKLTVQEIASFRQGCDLEAKLNNKLDIQTVDSSSNDLQIEEPQPSEPDCSKNDGDAGEVPSKVPQQVRSSTETVVIDTCYETAEEIRKDLESPTIKDDDDRKSNLSGISTKSIRDYITYSEPLTPMLQEVLDDFATEDEAGSDKEPEMTIVECPETTTINDDSSHMDSIDDNNENNSKKTNAGDDKSSSNKISLQNNEQENTENENCIILSDDGTSNQNIEPNKLQESNVSEKSESANKANQTQKLNDSDAVPEITTQSKDIPEVERNSFFKKSQDVLTQTHSYVPTDSLLPNNQEALNKDDSVDISVNECISGSKKRSKSLEIVSGIPAKKFCTERTLPPSVPSCNTVRNKNKSPNMDVNTGKTTSSSNEKQRSSKERNNSTNSNSACLPENRLSHRPQSKEQTISKPVEKDKPSQERKEATIVTEKETGRKTKSRTESDMRKEIPRKNAKEVTNEVVVLESRTDSEDQIKASPRKNKVSIRDLHKLQRDEALANALGLSSGAGRRKHRRQRNSLRAYQHSMQTSESSDWTSETDSDYISPPRGRKYRQTRKYLKPKSARILSLEEEGGLFVMYGKKICPVVKDGKIVKNFVTLSPGKEQDDEPFWKLKYVEEKKRCEELERLLKENKRQSVSTECKDIAAVKPIEKPATSAVDLTKEIPENNAIVKIDEPQKINEQQLIKPNEAGQQTIKMNFKNNNGEMQLEGHWSYMMEPVFIKRLGQILNPTPTPIITMPTPDEDQVAIDIAAVPRTTTPASTISDDLDIVKEKINHVEEEILNEIERRDKADSTHDLSPNDNVTKRSVRRTNKSSTHVADESPTKPKRGRKALNVNAADKASVVTRLRGTPKKTLSESEVNEVPIKETKAKKTPRKSVKGAVEEIESDDKHMAPSPKRGKKANQPNLKTSPNQKSKRKYTTKIPSVFSSPNISTNSIESTQGYQDSDVSICLRKKRKPSTTVLNKGKAKRHLVSKKKNRLYLVDEFSSDSWQSFSSRKSFSNENSSLNTEIYRTESYQILLPKRKKSFQHMEKIDETKQTLINNNYLDDFSLSLHENNSPHAINIPTPSFTNDEDSSQVTLPPSPVLSIVENISISKNALNSSNEPVDRTMDKIRKTKMLNEYMFIDVDMSVPLMEQECDIQRSRLNNSECHYNINVPETSQNITESLLNKVCTVNIRDCTLSDSIHKKITNLALDSAKKKTKRKLKKKDSENEIKMDVSEGKDEPKRKTKKRCSTPHRRQNKKNKDNIEPVIEQEHREACGSKKPCPQPRLLVTEADENPPDNGAEVDKETIPDAKNSKRRKVKNIIKVKIMKPKLKSDTSYSDNLQETKLSLQADSGINITESGVFQQGREGDVDLIHNHSDTCLHAHECIDSGNVDLIGDGKKAVLSLNTDTELLNELCDIFCENAQDAVSLFTVTDSPQTANTSEGIIKSDVNISSISSLITDDLSNESPQAPTTRNTTWYLLSEDDATNTNYLDIAPYVSSAGCGANLQEIFPITCAVPDLSTVTEENSTKFMLSDANTN